MSPICLRFALDPRRSWCYTYRVEGAPLLRSIPAVLPLLVAAVSPGWLKAAGTILTFDSLVDSTSITNQFSGLTFQNAAAISAGITLNEFEFPPHSGSNVAFDSGGAMTITFSSPIQSFAGYFTYSVPLTIQAFGTTGSQIVSVSSRFSSNEALSGVPGSSPNELIQLDSSAGISQIVITGSTAGTSFVLDDATVSGSPCDLMPNQNPTVSDVQSIINEALGNAPAINDFDGDGLVNVVDIQIEINAALSLGCGTASSLSHTTIARWIR